MVLDYLNGVGSQIGGVRGLEHLNGNNSLAVHLNTFLLSCRVNNLSPRSIEDYAQKIGAFIAFCHRLGAEAPAGVTPNHVRLFLLDVRERCKPVSEHGYYGTVNRFFNWLLEEELLEKSPFARMHPPKVPKTLIKPFWPEQVNTLLSLCDTNKLLGARNYAIILMFVDTGLRVGEMAGLQLQDVDIEREMVRVMGKGSKERVVRMGKPVQKALLRYLLMRKDKFNDSLPSLWVSEEGRPMHLRGIQIMVRRLGKRAGLQGVRCSPHTFRHSFGTWALKNGADKGVVQLLLGHSTTDMTDKYTATVTSWDVAAAHRKFSPVDCLGLT